MKDIRSFFIVLTLTVVMLGTLSFVARLYLNPDRPQSASLYRFGSFEQIETPQNLTESSNTQASQRSLASVTAGSAVATDELVGESKTSNLIKESKTSSLIKESKKVAFPDLRFEHEALILNRRATLGELQDLLLRWTENGGITFSRPHSGCEAQMRRISRALDSSLEIVDTLLCTFTSDTPPFDETNTIAKLRFRYIEAKNTVVVQMQ